MRAEQAARSEVQQALEAQRDAATGSSAEERDADAALGRQSQEFAAIDADLAAREREIEQNAGALEAGASPASATRPGEAELRRCATRRRLYGRAWRSSRKVKIVGPRGESELDSKSDCGEAGGSTTRTRRPSAPGPMQAGGGCRQSENACSPEAILAAHASRQRQRRRVTELAIRVEVAVGVRALPADRGKSTDDDLATCSAMCRSRRNTSQPDARWTRRRRAPAGGA